MMKTLILLLLLPLSAWCVPVVHVVPHSHCDAGYRLSFKQYYDEQVHKILDTMLEALNSSSSRKFVWEESSFLQYWWENDATSAQKALMKQLVMDKRLEMIGGGWTMHDEAVNNAATILSQMALGLKFLNESLNTRPKHEWHIDPFGHSIMMPELYRALEYDAIVINRIPDNIKQQMRKDKGLEFMWMSSTGASIFTHVLDMHYTTPLIVGLTTAEKAASLVTTCNERLKSFKTDHLLLPFGSDFNFQNATEKFTKFEKIMGYINGHPDEFKLRFQFSTLNDYFLAIDLTHVTDFPVVRNADFFPYIACYPCFSQPCGGVEGIASVPCGHQIPDAYWSGFYTSKPAQKLLVRQHEQSTTVTDILNSLYPHLLKTINSTLIAAQQTQALLTHHDAITGTSFPPAYDDYNRRMNDSLKDLENVTGQLQYSILCNGKTLDKINSFKLNTTATLAVLTDSNIALISVFNPVMDSRSDYARIKLPHNVCVKVSGPGGETKMQQVGKILYIPLTLGPLEIKTLSLTKIECPTTKSSRSNEHIEQFTNGFLALEFNDLNHVSHLVNITTGDSIGLSMAFDQMLEKKASLLEVPVSVCDGTNVYTYVPDKGSNPLLPPNKNISALVTSSGPLVWEVQLDINKDIDCPIQQTLRLFKPIGRDIFYQHFIEIQNTVGPLDGKAANSIVFSVNTTLGTSSKFTTYTSGLYPMERQYNTSIPPQGNYYPLVGRVSMQDDNRDIAVIVSTQRPMAVTSREGTLDLLVHRQIPLIDDPRGIDDSIMSDPMYFGLISSTQSNDVNEVSYNAMSLSQSPFTVYSTISPSLSDWYKQCNSTYTPINNPLPRGVKLLNMELLWKNSTHYSIGMRLVSVVRVAAAAEVYIDFSKLFMNAHLASVVRTAPDYLLELPSGNNTVLKFPQPFELVTVKLLFHHNYI